jgi:uncharacterized membrane protein (DUF4010 family)
MQPLPDPGLSLPLPLTWVPLASLMRLTLALAIGLFVGIEREWRGKEAGLRTFGFAALLGGIGGMLGMPFALAGFGGVAILVVFLNLQSMRANDKPQLELTTSAALLLAAMCGVLCGLGHTVTPAAVGVVCAWLLASKERLAGFSHKLTEAELRSAILLAVLAFAIYPILPAAPIDRFGLIVPREAWITVLLIAGIGFVNYLLWKVFGARGVEYAGFLGGLVNSTVTVTELATSVAASPGFADVAYRGVLLSVIAMVGRNAVLLGMLSPAAFLASTISLALMIVTTLILVFASRRSGAPPPPMAPVPAGPTDTSAPPPSGALVPSAPPPATTLTSPFSLASALKLGAIFLALQVVGTLAQSWLGRGGFYGVSLIGGLISSASSVASAGSLAAAGKVAPYVAGTGAILASLASAIINVGVVHRISGSPVLNRRVTLATLLVVAVGIAGAIAGSYVGPRLWIG